MRLKHHPPQPQHYVRSVVFAATTIVGTLTIGICGYHFLNNEPWIDALVDASMILGGMGQVAPLTSTAGKLFAAFYAVFCGLAFIGTAGVLLAPWVHRLLHRFHSDTPPDE